MESDSARYHAHAEDSREWSRRQGVLVQTYSESEQPGAAISTAVRRSKQGGGPQDAWEPIVHEFPTEPLRTISAHFIPPVQAMAGSQRAWPGHSRGSDSLLRTARNPGTGQRALGRRFPRGGPARIFLPRPDSSRHWHFDRSWKKGPAKRRRSLREASESTLGAQKVKQLPRRRLTQC